MQDAHAVLAEEVEPMRHLREAGFMHGTCGVCGCSSEFRFDATLESIRESMGCSQCGVGARQRAAAMVMLAGLEDVATASVYATEAASSLYVQLKGRVGRLRGSEYGLSLRRRLEMSRWLWRCGIYEVVRTEDVTALSHRDQSMHGVLCQDVLEHVPNYRKALAEFHRVLKPGGILVVTIPFYFFAEGSEQVADVDADGLVTTRGEPEYHGDPVNGGILCYHHFGWDFLGALMLAGFATADVLRVRDLSAGLPEGQWVIRAVR